MRISTAYFYDHASSQVVQAQKRKIGRAHV